VTYKVIQWATGTVAREAVKGIAGRSDLDLVGTWVHSEDKDGLDVGEICGIDPLGVTATRDKDAILALDADCVSFMQGRDWAGDPMPTFGVLLDILRSGKNVVNLWWPTLVNPSAVSDEVYGQLQEACLEGGSSIYTLGLDPGFGPLGLALSALNLARRVDSIHTFEFFNNGLWDTPDLKMFFGFGQDDVERIPILAPGVTTAYHGTTLHLLADALGVKLDEIVEEHSVIYADEDFEVPAAQVPKGTISGVRYQVKGIVDGEARVTLDHLESIRDKDYNELGFVGNGYRVELEGEPWLRMDLAISDVALTTEAVTTPAVYGAVAIAVAMAVVNAIPAVCDAAPGVLTILDLPLNPVRR
jgi:2,4-diaminopentanoate dehydrogenase